MNKFKVGDTVKVNECSDLNKYDGENGIIVLSDNSSLPHLVEFKVGRWWFDDDELELVEESCACGENCECKSPIGEEGRPTMDYELEYYRIVRELEDVKLVNEILLNYIREIQ